jgi:hypothetical protein
MASLLRADDFRSFWLGQTVSVIGDQVPALPLAEIGRFAG